MIEVLRLWTFIRNVCEYEIVYEFVDQVKREGQCIKKRKGTKKRRTSKKRKTQGRKRSQRR
jgi:hypothetical protein